MPEGPEIKIAADKIHKAIGGQECAEVFFAFSELKKYEKTLAGALITSIKPRGKALLSSFDNGLTIYSHNQLYGKWFIRKHKQYPKTNRQLRLAIHTENKSALLYSASDIEVLDAVGLAKHPFLSKLGPDILDDSCELDTIRDRVLDPRFKRRQLGHLLLDQSWVSGLGNYLRSEVLFVSRLAPNRKLGDLDQSEAEALAQAIFDLTKQSYKTKGITNDLGRVASLKADGVTRSQLRHHVFARAKRPCYQCGKKVEKIQWGARRLYYCASCQNFDYP